MRSLVVVGGGWAGTAAALEARALGLDVVLVDRGDRLRRQLAEAALADHLAARPLSRAPAERRPEGFRRAIRKAGEASATEADRRERRLARAGVDRIGGRGLVEPGSPARVRVDEIGESLVAADVLLATGSEPALVEASADGAVADDRARLLDERDAPASAIVVGGGREGVLLAGLLACAGTAVTLLERGSRLLAMADPEVSDAARRALERSGATVVLDAQVTAIRREDDAVPARDAREPTREVRWRGAADAPESATHGRAARVLVAASRRPDLAALAGSRGVAVPLAEGTYALGLPGTWAAGSATGRATWPEAAVREGRAAVRAIVGARRGSPARAHVPLEAVPLIVPGAGGAGWVGPPEATWRARGHAMLIGRSSLGGLPGFVKVVVDAGSGRLLSVHAAGPRAKEAVVLGAVAIEAGLGRADLRDLALPTGSAAEGLLDAVASAELA